MKKTFLMVLVGGMLMACHSNIDLNNVDTTAQVEMGVAVPVGSIRAQLGDFIGDIEGVYVSNGVITGRFAFADNREYHKLDMKQHISKKDVDLKVYTELNAKGLLDPDGTIKGTGKGVDITVPLHFDMPIQLKDINGKANLGKERLDSALIDNAQFSSVIGTTDLPIQWDWIDQVDLDLGSSVCRAAGKIKTVYVKGDAGNFGDTIKTDIDQFSISLMKNKNLNIEDNTLVDYANNVDSVVTFGVDFKLTIPKEAGAIKLVPTSKFNYHMQVEFIDYSAIWGFFSPDKDMITKKVEVDVDSLIGTLNMFDRISTPFTDPKIDVAVTTQMAGAMVLNGQYLYVIDRDGDSIFASFNGHKSKKYPLIPWLHPDPNKCPIGTTLTDTLHFSKAASEGQIDKLFGKLPKKLGYDFYVGIDSDESPQIRVGSDSKVGINAICTLPMKFREGLFIDFKDTIRNLDFSTLNIDSLIRETEVFDTLRAGEVTLFVTDSSEIPVSIKAVLTYLDKNNQPVKDPTDPSQAFNPFLEDTLRINPPRFDKVAGTWAPVEPGRSVFTAQMSKEKLEAMRDINKIVYRLIVDNEALNYAFDANPGLDEIKLSPDQSMKLTIGLTAQIDAVLNFNKK